MKTTKSFIPGWKKIGKEVKFLVFIAAHSLSIQKTVGTPIDWLITLSARFVKLFSVS